MIAGLHAQRNSAFARLNRGFVNVRRRVAHGSAPAVTIDVGAMRSDDVLTVSLDWMSQHAFSGGGLAQWPQAQEHATFFQAGRFQRSPIRRNTAQRFTLERRVELDAARASAASVRKPLVTRCFRCCGFEIRPARRAAAAGGPRTRNLPLSARTAAAAGWAPDGLAFCFQWRSFQVQLSSGYCPGTRIHFHLAPALQPVVAALPAKSALRWISLDV